MIDDSPPKPDWVKTLGPYIRSTNNAAARQGNPLSLAPQPSSTRTIAAGWSTYFTKMFRRHIYWSLRYAYRAPDFFVGAMAKPTASHTISFVSFDDDLTLDQLDGTKAKLQEKADIVYFSMHGSCSGGVYSAHLHAKDWLPTHTGLGQNGPVVIVFDTCDLVDLNNPNSLNQWKGNAVGPALRLVLGFAGQADVGKDPSRRGDGFATEMLAAKPISTAWLTSAHNTSVFHQNYDYAIAIALGDDLNDAQDVLDNASLSNWPQPRRGPTTEIVWKLCH